MFNMSGFSLLEGEQGFLTVHGKNVFPIHHLCRSVHGLVEGVSLAGEELVGALHAEVAHGVGVLHDERVHAALLQPVHGDDVGVEADEEHALGEAEGAHGLGGAGIGIKNVNDRLKIYFGRSYGLSITSEPDVGTCVEIRMPRIREGDYETK